MKTVILKWLMVVCVVVASAQEDAQESRVVQTTQGPVKGYKTDGVYNFYGIPYATAPTGRDRFKAPLPGPIWMHTFEAVNNKILCPQSEFPMPWLDTSSYTIQEDCLIANVYVPDTEETNLPVLVHIHGSAYHVGWGDMMKPRNLVKTKKMIAVTFNHRLGAHGFLCLGTEYAPGNAGLKDQVALLRWVQKNIAQFGGNPNEVTLSGSSAGSSAADLHILSKMSEGLFNRVIPESGASTASWSIQQDPIQNAKEFARFKNFTNANDIRALEEFYTTSPFDVLVYNTFMNRPDSSFWFSPCVERNIGVETFLEDSPVNILKQGKFRKVPVLYGFANMEGLIRIPNFEEWKNKMNKRFSDFLPVDLKFESEKEKTEVAKKVKEFYFGDELVGEETVQGYIDYFTDVMFAYSHLRATRLQVEAGSDSMYLYQYSFYSPPPAFMPTPKYLENIRGADHCAQSAAVHDSAFEMVEDTNEKFVELRKAIREMWLNFITTGKPVPEGSKLPAWPAAGANGSPHLDFGEEIKLKGPLLEKRARFWDDIYSRYYSSPAPPKQHRIRTEL